MSRPALDFEVIARCRYRFETTTLSAAALAREFGLHPDTIAKYSKTQHWQRPPITERRGRAGMVARLWAAAERQMTEIESSLDELPSDAAAREREARLMALLVRVTAGLAALDKAGAGPNSASATAAGEGAYSNDPNRDVDEFRRELESRLARLREPAAAQPAGDADPGEA